MSVIRKMPAGYILAYRIGSAVVRRREWMNLARRSTAVGNAEGVKWCVRAARQRNREVLELLRGLRECCALKEDA